MQILPQKISLVYTFMRAVIQRVNQAQVTINGQVHGAINKGLCVLLGISTNDTEQDVNWMVAKVAQMRIFSDAQGKMNLSLLDVGGEILIISQFTLHALTHKGNRPSFILAARPEQAIPLYESFKLKMRDTLNKDIACGIFGADMKVLLENDGPVTIILDSKQDSNQ